MPTKKRTEGLPVQVRPWIQDFRDYAFDRRIFGVAEIRDQIRGADEGGGAGWMLWNPRNDYTAAALRPGAATLAKKSPAPPLETSQMPPILSLDRQVRVEEAARQRVLMAELLEALDRRDLPCETARPDGDAKPGKGGL